MNTKEQQIPPLPSPMAEEIIAEMESRYDATTEPSLNNPTMCDPEEAEQLAKAIEGILGRIFVEIQDKRIVDANKNAVWFFMCLHWHYLSIAQPNATPFPLNYLPDEMVTHLTALLDMMATLPDTVQDEDDELLKSLQILAEMQISNNQ